MPDQITKLLDQIDRLDQEATKKPWIDEDNALREILYHQRNELGGYAGSASLAEVLTNDADAEFIALARTALPKLAEAVYQVLALLDAEENRPSRITEIDGLQRPARVPTSEVRRAITDAMEGDDD